MREFEVRRGNYTGKHIIYDGVKEAMDSGIKYIVSPWYRPDAQIGDWCVADDGYVLQLLHKNKMINKRHTSGQYTVYYRFCTGTVYVYYGRNGKTHIKNFYGAVANSNKSALGGTPTVGRYMTNKKKYFVTLLVTGLDPYNAYIKAYKTNQMFTKSASYIWRQIDLLLSDPLVKKELMKELKPTVKLLEEEIKKETGFANLQDWLVNELTTLLTKSKGLRPKDRRDNIRLVVTLFAEPLGFSTNKKNNQIEEAEWQFVPPPSLQQHGEINEYNSANRIDTSPTHSDNVNAMDNSKAEE